MIDSFVELYKTLMLVNIIVIETSELYFDLVLSAGTGPVGCDKPDLKESLVPAATSLGLEHGTSDLNQFAPDL